MKPTGRRARRDEYEAATEVIRAWIRPVSGMDVARLFCSLLPVSPSQLEQAADKDPREFHQAI